MKKDVWLWQLFGLTFTVVLGTILHFLYDWTDWVAVTPFSAINESTWEHMKILFFPMLFFAGIQSMFFGKEYENFWGIKCKGILLGVIAIPVLFYTYNGAFGQSPAWVNVLIFFLSAFLGFLWEYTAFQKPEKGKMGTFIAGVTLGVVAFLFIIFTYLPPFFPLFQDPISKGYGFVFYL